MSDERQTIQIKGVKMDVDLRTAVRIDTLRVGDRVKVLKGATTYEGAKVHPGVVIGFEPFKTMPTVIVAFMEAGYGKHDLKFLYYNESSKDVEVIKSLDDDLLVVEKENVDRHFEREIAKKEGEIRELEEKRDYFHNKFRSYWAPVETAEATSDDD